MLTKNTKSFIKNAMKIHGNKYNYSKSIYKGSHNHLLIICNRHGAFNQTATTHLSGSGCPKCANINKANKRKKSIYEFIQEADKKHNHKYNYSKSNYITGTTTIEIICPFHGSFFQKPRDHLNNGGCSICGRIQSDKNRKYTTEEFILKAKEKHGNKYDYSNTIYIDSNSIVMITCKIHGPFQQRAYRHLYNAGCPICGKIISKLENEWLDFMKVSNHLRQKRIKINNILYIVDAYNPETNTIYEFYGDYWHGNINNPRFSPNEINKRNNKTFKELYKFTLQKEEYLKSNGYNVISIWEMDWKLFNHIK